jgi:hypothetical protein
MILKIGIFILSIAAFLVIVRFFSYFFIFGGPDSPFVKLVGRKLKNFIEYKKTGTVSIDKSLTVIYLKRTYNKYTEANKPGDEKNIIIKKLSGEPEEIIFQGNLGHTIKKVIVDKENHLLFYTLQDGRKEPRSCYLNIFDLNDMRNINKIKISDKEGCIYKLFFDEINRKIFFKMVSTRLPPLLYDIVSGSLKEISNDEFEKISNSLNVPESSFIHFSKDGEKKLFFIKPFSDFLPANYKPKYNGVYINNGSSNIRISKSTNSVYSSSDAIWIEDGEKVIYGAYLFDTSGKSTEIKICDGIVLAAY